MSEIPINQILCGDAVEELKKLPDESIQMSMCSPPYWGLRNYQINGQYGLEKTPQDYIDNMQNVFKEVYRILKKDGTCWVNIGDTYCSQPPGNKINDKHQLGDGLYGRLIDRNAMQEDNAKNIISGRFDKQKYGGKNSTESGRGRGGDYKDKCMLMMPERFAFMMIDLGFILRNKIVWFKRNAMPSSIKDRFTCTWEYVYFFSKSRRYYFNLDSIRQPLKYLPGPNDTALSRGRLKPGNKLFNYRVRDAEKKKNQCPQFKASEDEILKYKDKGLAEVKNLHGQCDEQGRRIQIGLRTKLTSENYETKGMINLSKRLALEKNDPKYKWHPEKYGEDDPQGARRGRIVPNGKVSLHPLGKNPGDHWDITTRGYKEAHFAVYPEELCLMPIKAGSRPGDIVLDPFAGACTTCLVAKKLGRHYIGIDLKPTYCQMGRDRIEKTCGSLF